jgi:hypothetical protein
MQSYPNSSDCPPKILNAICDGCLLPGWALTPIGDGTLRVCDHCLPVALAFIQTHQGVTIT